MGAGSSREGASLLLHRQGAIAAAVMGAMACVCLSACKPQFENTLPPGFTVDRAFGQLYDDGTTKRASHYVIVTLPLGTSTALAVSDGTIEYLPENNPRSHGLGNCLVLRPRTYPVTANDFSQLKALPGPASIVLAYCNLDEDTVKAKARAMYAIALPGESGSDLDAAAAHFIAGDETFKWLDVHSNGQSPLNSSELGDPIGRKLYLAAFVEDDSGARDYVNPLPYLAGVIPAATLDSIPPAPPEIVIETSPTADFSSGVVQQVISPSDQIGTPLARVYLRVGLRSNEKMMAAGDTVVPYRVSVVLTNNALSPAVRLRSTSLLNEMTYQDAPDIARQTYGSSAPVPSDPASGVYWVFPLWNERWPAASSGNDAINGLENAAHILDLNRSIGEEEAFPGGDYELALTVGDIPNSAPTRTIRFTLKAGLNARLVEDTNNDHQITAADQVVPAVHIARWDNAYINHGDDVRNEADPGNFIEQDPSRFYVRIKDDGANTNPATIETIHARIGTVDRDLAINDDLTDVALRETAANSGIFVSRSQILTTNLLEYSTPSSCVAGSMDCQDDEFFAHDGAPGGSLVADDAPGDRTHRADIEGKVRVVYRPVSETEDLKTDIPVCRRDPDERRKIEIKFVVFLEPFHDDGLGGTGQNDGKFTYTPIADNDIHEKGEKSEKYLDMSSGDAVFRAGDDPQVKDGRGPIAHDSRIDAELARANIAWAQACIKFVKYGPTVVIPAPLKNNVDILEDEGKIAGDFEKIFNWVADDLATDRITAVYAGYFDDPGHFGQAFLPARQEDVHQGELAFTLLTPFVSTERRTLAHELGHLITNTFDETMDLPFFYPRSSSTPDSAVNSFRRITRATMEQAQTRRPMGDLNHVGNSFRKPL